MGLELPDWVRDVRAAGPLPGGPPGARVHAWRARLKIKARELAGYLGVSAAGLGHIERGARAPSLVVALKLELATRGAVRVEDWPDFTEVPALVVQWIELRRA